MQRAVMDGESETGITIMYMNEGLDTGEDLVPRVYPVAETIGGLGGVSEAISFLGESLFLSERGLEAIERSALCEERGLLHRSSAVDARLLRDVVDGDEAGVMTSAVVLLTHVAKSYQYGAYGLVALLLLYALE